MASPNARMHTRRNLMQRYNIVFDGPVAPHQWPQIYVPIFQKIREIENIRYERYVEDLANRENETNDPLVPIPERVTNLVRAAYDMRNSLANEATWRNRTEKIVLDRFHSDMPCDHCHKKRWVSRFHLDPLYPLAAERLRAKRARTILCTCRHVDRMRNRSLNTLQSPFLYRESEPIIDHSVPEFKNRTLRTQRPDLVFGLRQTAKLQSLLSGNPGILDTPFGKSPSPSFPFLLLEAKPEYGCPGFTSVEEQSAFPLRTLLNIQKNVPTTAEARFEPLVWFMANQGDEWRIYACVPDDSKTRIIDLWHGSILREDSALQILLIVDMLCDWARDIYRKEIMKCLASAIIELREVTPADSHVSYNPHSGEETSANQSGWDPLPVDNDARSSHIENDLIGSSNDFTSPLDLVQNEGEDGIYLGDLHPSSELASTPNAAFQAGITSFDMPAALDVEMVDSGHEDENRIVSIESEVQNAVIRHANHVIFAFQTLALPEAESDLISLLTSSSTTRDIVQAADKLFMLFCGTNHILMKGSTVRYLQYRWTRAEDAREPHNSSVHDYDDDDDDDIVITHFSFKSYFRQQDWKLVRELTCIIASSNTVETLARISSIWRPIENNYRGEFLYNRFSFLVDTVFLTATYGEGSAKSGISNLHLYLRQDSASYEGRPRYEWRKTIPQIRNILDALHRTERLIKVSNFKRPTKISFCPTQALPYSLDFMPQIRALGAFLAKRPDSWPESCPKYSLIVFDESNIEDGHLMASKISMALSKQAFFHERRGGITQLDVRAFELWAQKLRWDSTMNLI